MRWTIALPLLALLAACGSSKEPTDISRLQATTDAAPEAHFLPLIPAGRAFGDVDPHEWDGITPSEHLVHGIDVSRWQGEIDWFAARNSGVAFAFLKATEGGDYVDPTFQRNWVDAKRAGVPRAAYHFYYFCRPAKEQARWFIENVPRDAAAMPHVLDMEWNHHSKTCRLRPDGKTVKKEAEKFLDILTRHYGQRPIIYTTVDFFHETGIGEIRNTNFWLRSVAGHPGQVYPGADWAFWQYTGTGLVPGIEGKVDLNVFHGNGTQWAQWRGYNIAAQ